MVNYPVRQLQPRINQSIWKVNGGKQGPVENKTNSGGKW